MPTAAPQLNDANRIDFRHRAEAGLVSVVIACGPDFKPLDTALEGLSKLDAASPRHEIIVANDGGFEGLSAICARHNVCEVVVTPNGGVSVARNAALGEARGEFIAFLDADAVPDPRWLCEGIAALADHDYVAGKVLIDEAQIRGFAHYHDLLFAYAGEVYIAEGFGTPANLLVKRAVIETVGGFDIRLRAAEDREFGIRVRGAGYRQSFAPGALVLHPPRDHAEKLRKIRREIHSHTDLYFLYPEAFAQYRPRFGLVRDLAWPPKSFRIRRSLWARGPLWGIALYLYQWRLGLARARETARYIGLDDRPRPQIKTA